MDESRMDVVWPLGAVARPAQTATRKTVGLAGARLAFAWDYAFKGDQMWRIVQAELRERFPKIEFIGPEAFGNIHDKFGSNDVGNVGLKARIRELGVTAALVGVGA